MLHPALTRFLAVLLAILCLILAAVSYSGLSEAEELKEDDAAEHKKLTERIDTYERLGAELAQLEEYKKANEELEKQEEEHDSSASQHRTELAEHTAKEGAFKQGADKLWEGKAQIEEQKIVFNLTVEEFNKKEAEFNKLKESAQGMAALAQGCAQVAQLPVIPDPGPAPAQPQAPAAPVEPIVPPPPEAFTQTQPLETDYPDNPEGYQAALAAYLQAKADHDARQAAHDQALAAQAEYETKLNEYKTQLDTFNNVTVPAYEQAMALYTPMAQAYQQYSAAVTPLMQGGAAALSALGKAVPSDIAGMAQALQQAYNEFAPQISEGEKLLEAARIKLEAAEKTLKDAEHKIQTNLELIWYQMGQSEEQAAELAEEKEALHDNSAQLEKERELLEKQKENENKHRSARILLMNNKTIEERVNAGGELTEVSKQYAEEFKVQYEQDYKIRRIICFLGMAAGIVGLLMLPAAFELIKSRFLLLMPAILSLLCSGTAEYLSVRSGEGQFYTAIPVVFFSLFYILAARGRKKIIRG